MNMVLQSYPAVNNLKPLFQADLDKQVSQSVSYRGREDFPSVLHAPDDVVVDVVDACPGMNIFTHTDIIVRKCQEVSYHHCFILYIYLQIYIVVAFISDTSNQDFPRPFIKEVDCVESFNVAGMLKNHHLAKAIADCSWGELCRQLKCRSILTNEFFLFAYNKGR